MTDPARRTAVVHQTGFRGKAAEVDNVKPAGVIAEDHFTGRGQPLPRGLTTLGLAVPMQNGSPQGVPACGRPFFLPTAEPVGIQNGGLHDFCVRA